MNFFDFLENRDIDKFEFPRLENDSLVIFQHLPKTAGVSFSHLLRSKLKPWKIVQWNRVNESWNECLEELNYKQYKLVGGHLKYKHIDKFPFQSTKGNLITIIRNPITRLISHYYYGINPETPTSKSFIKKYPSFEYFLDSFPDNYMATQWLIGNVSSLEEAIPILKKRYCFIGLTEFPNLSSLLLTKLLNSNFETIENHNNNNNHSYDSARKEIFRNQGIINLITEKQKLDIEIYNYLFNNYQVQADILLRKYSEDFINKSQEEKNSQSKVKTTIINRHTNTSTFKKKFTIYGNCQASILAKFMLNSKEFRKQYEYIPIPPVYTLNDYLINQLLDEVFPSLDLLIYQPVSNKLNGEQYSSNYISKFLKNKCQLVSFPSCYFKGYFPELDQMKLIQDKTNKFVLSFQGKDREVLVHDYNIVKAFLENFTAHEASQFAEIDSFYSKTFSIEAYEKSIDSLKLRERNNNVDIVISDYIHQNYKKIKLFHTHNHPSGNLLYFIASKVISKIKLDPNFDNLSLDPFSELAFPTYNSTYINLSLEFQDIPSPIISSESISRLTIVNEYYKYYSLIPRKTLINSNENWHMNLN